MFYFSPADCDETFQSSEFNIQSPNYPKNYINQANCKYRIIRQSDDICSLNFTFISFDVESSENCQYDYMEINGQKMCGTIPSNTQSTQICFMFCRYIRAIPGIGSWADDETWNYPNSLDGVVPFQKHSTSDQTRKHWPFIRTKLPTDKVSSSESPRRVAPTSLECFPHLTEDQCASFVTPE